MSSSAVRKQDVRDFWNADPCGTRYVADSGNLDAHARARYSLEPYIFDFAQFQSARGRRVLEIGVGMGADYLEWLKAGALATGIDISEVSVDRARARCKQARLEPDLRVADAEQLPFPENSFDVVYSYGVMHHSPDTRRCVEEAWRVLKPGGQARIMVYHHASITGLMLWLRYGLFSGISLRQSVFDHLESPGTKTYTQAEAVELFERFNKVHIEIVFSPGDLLLNQPSARFQGWFYRMTWKFFPRRLIRAVGRRWGLFLLITADKPV